MLLISGTGPAVKWRRRYSWVADEGFTNQEDTMWGSTDACWLLKKSCIKTASSSFLHLVVFYNLIYYLFVENICNTFCHSYYFQRWHLCCEKKVINEYFSVFAFCWTWSLCDLAKGKLTTQPQVTGHTRPGKALVQNPHCVLLFKNFSFVKGRLSCLLSNIKVQNTQIHKCWLQQIC